MTNPACLKCTSVRNSPNDCICNNERRCDECNDCSWCVDIHQDGDSQLPNIGDCFGDACEEEVVVEVQTSDDDFSDYLKITILISLVAVIILTISIIKDSSSVDEKLYIDLEEE